MKIVEIKKDSFFDKEFYNVYDIGVHASHSVLCGCVSKSFVGSYDSKEAALKEHPDAELSEGIVTDIELSHNAPSWFDEADAGECWDDNY